VEKDGEGEETQARWREHVFENGTRKRKRKNGSGRKQRPDVPSLRRAINVIEFESTIAAKSTSARKRNRRFCGEIIARRFGRVANEFDSIVPAELNGINTAA